MLYQLSYTGQARTESLERETGIEPATNSLEGCDSTIELLPQSLLAHPLPDPFRPRSRPRPRRACPPAEKVVAREGFEPSKPLGQQIYSLPRLTAPQPRHVPRVGGPACMIVMSGMDVPRLALVPKPGAGEGIRTPDRLITNQLLYRAELRQRGQSRKSSMPAARQQTPFRSPTGPRRRARRNDRNLQV